jgi:hypothetical protein
MPLLLRHLWLLCIAATIINALIFWVRSRHHGYNDPSLEGGYCQLFWGILTWGNIPWVIMGLGILVGGVPSTFHYFRPRDGNPFVLAFFASVFIIWALGTYWLFVRNGAEMITRHPGLFNGDIKSPAFIKLFWCLCLAGGIVGAVAMFVTDIVPPG